MKLNHCFRARRLPLLLAAVSAIALTFATGYAQEPVPAPAPAPAAQPATPPPAAPAPAEAPKPAVEAPKRKEEETEAPAPAEAPAGASSLGTRVSAALKALQGQGAIVNQLADRDREIVSLRSDVSSRDVTINRLNAELVQLRAERTEIESAMRTLESRAAGVTETVAGLGFPASQLPAASTLEQAENSAEGLQEQMKNEKSSTKRAEIAQRIIELRDTAARKRAGQN